MIDLKTLRSSTLAAALLFAAGSANAGLSLVSWQEDVLWLKAEWSVDTVGGFGGSFTKDGAYWDILGLSASTGSASVFSATVPIWGVAVEAQHAFMPHEPEFGPIFATTQAGVFGSTMIYSAMAPHMVNGMWQSPADWTTPHYDHYELKVVSDAGGTAHIYLNAIHPVPEPESAAMLLAGLGVMAAVARRRRR